MFLLQKNEQGTPICGRFGPRLTRPGGRLFCAQAITNYAARPRVMRGDRSTYGCQLLPYRACITSHHIRLHSRQGTLAPEDDADNIEVLISL